MARQFFPVENQQGQTVACWDEVNQCWAPVTLCNGNGASHQNPWAVPMVFGKALTSETRRIGAKMKLDKRIIDNMIKLEPFRTFMVAYLRSTGKRIPINNRNNMFEVALHYAKVHPQTAGKVPDQLYKEALGLKPMLEKMDWGAAINGIVGLVSNIIGAAGQGAVNNFLATWAAAFKEYMKTDFANIENTFNASASAPGAWGGWGPYGALEMIRQYQRTSWLDLKNTIVNYCQSQNVAVPADVLALFEAQAQLKRDMQDAMDRAVSAGQDPGAGNGGSRPAGSTGSSGTSGGGSSGSGSGGGNREPSDSAIGAWISKNVVVIVIGLIVIVGIGYFATRSGKGRSKAA